MVAFGAGLRQRQRKLVFCGARVYRMDMLPRFQIILVCMLGAVLYGIAHDQITARICVEYFNPGHPLIFGDILDPTLLGLGWGVVATWWVGFFLGVPLALCCTVGQWPQLPARRMIKPVAVTLLMLALLAACSGFAGYLAGVRGYYPFDEELADPGVSGSSFALRWTVVHTTHLASYVFGGVQGLGLCGWAIWRRWRLAEAQRQAAGTAAAAARVP
jgi:hypothetical protein